MITEELLLYITRQLKSGTPRDLIIARLVGAGWKLEDVNDGLSKVDIYHEPIFNNPEFDEIKKENIFVKEKEKAIEESVKDIGTKIDLNLKEETIKNVEEPRRERIEKQETSIVLDTLELGAPIKEPINNLSKEEEHSKINLDQNTSKIWVPKSVPVKEKPVIREISSENKNPSVASSTDIGSIHKVEDTDSPVSKEIINSFRNSYHLYDQKNTEVKDTPVKEEVKDISKIAMLASYKSDVISVTKKDEEKVQKVQKVDINKKKSKLLPWLILLLLIIGGVFYLFYSGLIKLEEISILDFNKKDPKIILLERTQILSSLKSYKAETTIDVTSPIIKEILSGIPETDDLSKKEKEFLNINILSLVNKDVGGVLADSFITMKGTSIKDYLTLDIKRLNDDFYFLISSPNKSEDKFYPDEATIKINKSELNLIPELFNEEKRERINRANLYNIFSDVLVSNINTNFINSYSSFVNNTALLEKEVEFIKGVESYHYSLDIDPIFAKNILKSFYESVSSYSLSNEIEFKLKDLIDSTNIKSLDVWVGKKDNQIYEYSFVLDFPLSKIIDYEIIAEDDHRVSISWKTTLYDFNIQNNVFIPSEFNLFDNVKDGLRDIKIKNEMISFANFSNKIFSEEKGFPKKVNTNGDCASPVLGSVFSKEGHTPDISFGLNLIDVSLKNILNEVGDKGSCYSSLSGWSMTVPINSNKGEEVETSKENIKYFCVDSTGAKEIITSYPKKSTCLSKIDTKDTLNVKTDSVKQ